MAASMILGQNKKLCLSSRILKTIIRQAQSASVYYVLLPEVPPDTAETNPVMRYNNYPQFSQLTPDICVTGPAKLAIQYETKLGNVIERCKDPKEEKTFETIFEPIERATVPLHYAYSTVHNLYYMKKNTDFTKAFDRIYPQIERAKIERFHSETLYNSLKEIAANYDNLNEYQQRVVDNYILQSKLSGIELGSKRQLYFEISKLIVHESNYYRRNVNIVTQKYKQRIDDFSKIQDLPKPILTYIAEDRTNPSRGPWTLTLHPEVYLSILNYCSDRPTRWHAWKYFNTRCGTKYHTQNLANKPLLEDIILHRSDLAKHLGYNNFAEISMETKMAGSVENVLSMIQTYKSKFSPIVGEEVAQLQQFAASEGFKGSLEMWDVYYWRRRQRDHLYKFDENKVFEYFPFERVLDKLFTLCNELFGITIKESDTEVDIWHKDVRFYKVYDENGTEVSAFYMDPYRRKERHSIFKMHSGRDRSDLMGTKPFSYLYLFLNPPVSSTSPVLMSFDDVEQLFKAFGNGLQQMLAKGPYSEYSGQRNMELDAVEICANFMKRWCHEPQFLQNISSHVDTQEPIPMELIETVLNSRKHFAKYDMIQLLYCSAFDMEIYMGKDRWFEKMQSVWKDFMPLPLNEDDIHPYSFTQIVSEEHHAAFYSFIWSEMIAADIFETFKEVGHNKPEKMAEIGKRFRDTFLTIGSGIPASEVFRRFRGRDPTLDALLNEYNISTD